MVRIIGTPLDDNLVGTSTTDDIFGLAGNDRIDGRDGNDRLFGGPGADQLLGDLGNDLLFGEDADDLLAGGPGDDMLFGGTGSDTLFGDDGADLLAGAAGVDTLLGGAGHDLLAGAADDDTVIGGAGDDVLDGGRGDNRLSGDAGADRFILTDFDVDEILDLDLGEGDVVDFSALAQQALSAGLSLGEAGGPFGTTLLVDVGDGNGFREAVLLRGAEPAVEVISNGGLVELARPVAVPLVSLSLADLDSSNGFRLEGIDPDDFSGGSVSGARDVNADSLADVIIGAEGADPNGDSSGRAYVVFGKADGTTVELADVIAGTGGFALNGVAVADGFSGLSASGAGDVDGDGLGDLIVGASGVDVNGANSGQSYVVFGKFDGTTVELADVVAGIGGFAVNGVAVGDSSGLPVAGVGDVNGDGLADVTIGATGAAPNGENSGQSYVVFGKADGGTVDLAEIVGESAVLPSTAPLPVTFPPWSVMQATSMAMALRMS